MNNLYYARCEIGESFAKMKSKNSIAIDYMEKLTSNMIEELIGKLMDKIDRGIDNIDNKDSLKNISAFKKIVDSIDKLILLKEKLDVLKQAEITKDVSEISKEDNIIIENYLSARLKHLHNQKLNES